MNDAASPDTMSGTEIVPTVQGRRGRGGRFRKGFSGNPFGGNRGKHTPDYKRCRELCRVASEDSARGMIALAKESLDDRVRFMALQWVYEQAWGKAREYDP